MVLSSSMQCPSSSQNTEKGPETEGPSTLGLNQNGPQYTHKVEILHMEETKHHESENKWHEEDIRIINPKEKQDNYCLQNNNRSQRIGMYFVNSFPCYIVKAMKDMQGTTLS
jgi:hypothetical protein